MLSKNKIKSKLVLSLITFFLIFSLTNFSFAEEGKVENLEEKLTHLRKIFNSSPYYSDFKKTEIINAAGDLLRQGVSFSDAKNIIENYVKKSIDDWGIVRDIKIVFAIILETQQEGLPTQPLINKINEGFAKNVNKSIIISVISAKAENLKQANEILNEARQEGLEINGSEEIIEILASSLENDVPQEALSWLVKTGTKEGRSIEEITEINEELSYLSLMAYDSGLSTEKISLLFKKAIDSSSNLADICENIQKNLESEISTAKIESGGVKPSTTLGSGTSPTSLTGSETTIGGTPTQEAGEAPTETGGAPEPSTPPAEETPSPPEN